MGTEIDLKVPVFTTVTVPVGLGSVLFSSPIQFRRTEDYKATEEVFLASLHGNVISLGGASLLTFIPQVSVDASGPNGMPAAGTWQPLATFGAVAVSGNVSTQPLLQFQWTWAAAGLMPPVSIAPEAPWFRLGVYADAGAASLSVIAYLQQAEENP